VLKQIFVLCSTIPLICTKIIDGICKECFVKHKGEGLGSKANLVKDTDVFFVKRGRYIHRTGLRNACKYVINFVDTGLK
jgi:hypothetical protein